MRSGEERSDMDVDEYLWPLTGDATLVDWRALTAELQIRERLAEISAHVREVHVQPRLARLGRLAPAARLEVTRSIIDGPAEGPPWAQTLKDPVPRALRDEWAALSQQLRELQTCEKTTDH